jgi:hypothetical protein
MVMLDEGLVRVSLQEQEAMTLFSMPSRAIIGALIAYAVAVLPTASSWQARSIVPPQTPETLAFGVAHGAELSSATLATADYTAADLADDDIQSIDCNLSLPSGASRMTAPHPLGPCFTHSDTSLHSPGQRWCASGTDPPIPA